MNRLKEIREYPVSTDRNLYTNRYSDVKVRRFQWEG